MQISFDVATPAPINSLVSSCATLCEVRALKACPARHMMLCSPLMRKTPFSSSCRSKTQLTRCSSCFDSLRGARTALQVVYDFGPNAKYILTRLLRRGKLSKLSKFCVSVKWHCAANKVFIIGRISCRVSRQVASKQVILRAIERYGVSLHFRRNRLKQPKFR